jgi:hypothetical protein
MKKSEQLSLCLLRTCRFRVVRTKKGEVVGPAGGETGVPRCLAEVRKLLKAALFHYFWIQATDANFYKKVCQIKKNKNFSGGHITPTSIHLDKT